MASPQTFGMHLIAGACACVACMVGTGTLIPYLNTVYIKKKGESKSTKAEKATAITFFIIMFILLVIYKLTTPKIPFIG